MNSIQVREQKVYSQSPNAIRARERYRTDPKIRIKQAIRYQSRRVEINLRNQAKREALKIETLSHYGKNGLLQCRWEGCDIIDVDMLSLDHIADDGWRDQKNWRRGGILLFRLLKKLGFPNGFQTLCHNHQWKKELSRRRELRIS